MGLLEYFGIGQVEDREVPAEPAPLPNLPPVLFPTTPSGSPLVSPANALGVADVFACVRCLSDAVASVPLIPYRKTTDGRTRVDGRLSDLLRRPAPAHAVVDGVDDAIAAQLDGDAIGVQESELLDVALEGAELADKGVAEKL